MIEAAYLGLISSRPKQCKKRGHKEEGEGKDGEEQGFVT